jgi:putative ABC transport system permease protein
MVNGVSGRFWVRWSLRDLRAHWVAVVAIAVVIAIGTGVYAGLSSTSTWRRLSNDASFAAGNLHDLRVTTAPGNFVDQGVLSELVASIPSSDDVGHVTERLVVDSQLEAEAGDGDGGDVLVTARIVGGTLDADAVDRVWLRDGAAPAPGTASAVLEAKFADFHGLPTRGTVAVASDPAVAYTGVGVAPEDFYVAGPEGTVIAEADLATVYMHLADAQALIGRPGSVNDVVLTVVAGGDVADVERELRDAAASVAGAGLTVTGVDAVDAHRVLYQDIDNDQQLFTAFAVLVLVAAALAAFNLVNRIVEAQRREIGIGMALGAPRRQLSVRPLMVGVQIAVTGVIAGVVIGWMVARAMQGMLESLLPMPEYRTPFQIGTFAKAAALGVAIPILASAWPVWRAVHVEPIEAIRTGHLTARAGRATDLSRRMRLPGSSVGVIPMRNLLRTPRRTVLTATGVGVAIAALVSVLGMLDSFGRAIDASDSEITRGDRDRVIVQLTTPMTVDDPRVSAIVADPSVGTADLGLRVPATAIHDGDDAFDLLIDSYDFETAVWTPGPHDADGARDGLVVARKAADDLGIQPGETIRIRHPVRTGQGLDLVESNVEVSALHDNPIRTFAYLDDDTAIDLFGVAGITNLISVTPAGSTTPDEVQRALFGQDGVASTMPVARIGEAFDDALAAFTGFLLIVAVAVLVLAVLIAFNAARIAVEERQRDHATMRAFGLPVRSILGIITKESVVIGALATLIGVAIGTLMLDWMLGSLTSRTLPEFGIARYIAPSTLAWAAGIGIGAVSVAPLFLVRRIRNMDLPSTLRVME